MPIQIPNESEYVLFEYVGTSDSGKTVIYNVLEKRYSSILGQIRWFAPWRQYCFYPKTSSVYDHSCLTAIGKVLAALMDDRKKPVFANMVDEDFGQPGD